MLLHLAHTHDMETAVVTGFQRLTVAATGFQTTVSLLVQRCLLLQQLHLHHTYNTVFSCIASWIEVQ